MLLHQSVLTREVIEWLDLAPGKTILDGTLGSGGHAAAILDRLGPGGKLIGCDKDADALAEASRVLEKYGDQCVKIHADFSEAVEQLRKSGPTRVDGILLDLGVSSMQLDRPERGFSFRFEGPLDMRMDGSAPIATARELVNRLSEEALRDILYRYGEERLARRIASAIVRERSRRAIETTSQLAQIVWNAVPVPARHGRIHPATRTFQALRLAVNGEIESLETLLQRAPELLTAGGRLVVLSFHSLEDRLVKHSLRRYQQEGLGRVLTKKPVTPREDEIAVNPRSRSAKLRAFERAGEP